MTEMAAGAPPSQGCPEAQPGLQAQEAPPSTCPCCPRCLDLPHGLQWCPAAVATPGAPLLAQGCQDQGQPWQLRKGRPAPRWGLERGGQGCVGRAGVGGWTRMVCRGAVGRLKLGGAAPQELTGRLGDCLPLGLQEVVGLCVLGPWGVCWAARSWTVGPLPRPHWVLGEAGAQLS